MTKRVIADADGIAVRVFDFGLAAQTVIAVGDCLVIVIFDGYQVI